MNLFELVCLEDEGKKTRPRPETDKDMGSAMPILYSRQHDQGRYKRSHRVKEPALLLPPTISNTIGLELYFHTRGI